LFNFKNKIHNFGSKHKFLLNIALDASEEDLTHSVGPEMQQNAGSAPDRNSGNDQRIE
jgi:hypothetical protein